MKVSVIIATKNEEKNIVRLLKSLKRQTEKNIEIIIVDNFSEDKTRLISSEFTKKIYEFGSERSSQRNHGLKMSKGEYIFFADADMELKKNVLKECIEKISSNEVSGVLIDEISTGKNFLAKIKNLEKRLYRQNSDIEAARFFRKKDLQKIGGYDSHLISAEDWDLTIRIKKLGNLAKINSKIMHFENDSIWRDITKKYYYAKNIQRYAHKHPKEFTRQAGASRVLILFVNPKIILENIPEFLGLIFLKTAQFLAFQLSKIQ